MVNMLKKCHGCKKELNLDMFTVDRSQDDGLDKNCKACKAIKIKKHRDQKNEVEKKRLVNLFPDIAKEWHPTKNENLDLMKILSRSSKRAWWVGKCGHEYETIVFVRTKYGCGCPYCNSNRKALSILNSHPELALQWHPTKNDCKPDDVTSGSHKKIWWFCEFGHEWKVHVSARAKDKITGCPYCYKIVREEKSLLFKFPEIASEWHPTKNGDLKSRDVSSCSNDKAWWLGKCGHCWSTSINNRTTHKTQCPSCKKSKGEQEIEKALTSFGIKFIPQATFENCKDKRNLKFDFRVGNILIEYQGIQHFEPVNFGDNKHIEKYQKTQERDEFKREWCKSNGYTLLEIPYTNFCNIPKIIKEIVNGEHPRRS